MGLRPVALLDAAVPLTVGAVIVAVALADPGGRLRPVPLGLELAAAASLAARRRAPLGTLAGSAALVLVALHLDPRVAPVAVLAPAVALFSLALRRGRSQQLAAAGIAILTVLLADVLRGGAPGVAPTLGHMGLVSIPLLAAEALRTRRSNTALLVERLTLEGLSREEQTQRRIEQERVRIARDLHDVVAHTLTTINVQAATAAQLIEHDPAYARAALQTIEEASRDATAELRAILGVLRDRDSGAAPRAPSPGLGGVPDLVQHARDAGLDAKLEISGNPPDRLLDAVSLSAYRIVQESLTNVHRHAAGAPVQVRLRFGPDRLCVIVRNAGAPASAAGEGGVGILGMTERAEALGGHLYAGPVAGGFRVAAELPYSAGPA